ncbi:MAG: hypothetical protein OEV21_03215 [Thermoplasmata archaeon]|nr:hypothetical protein [Thermoplasmata archaeon]
MINPECESILGHLMFHRALIDDSEETDKGDRLEKYVKMVEEMKKGIHTISSDPFERSVSIAFELVVGNKMNPWEIDLIEFSKMYLQKVKKTEDINLLVAGRLVLMAWEIFRMQTEDLLIRVDKPDTMENYFDGWDTDAIQLYSEIGQPSGAIEIMNGGIQLTEAARRAPTERQVSLVELLDAFEEAKHEVAVRAEISKYLQKYKPKDFDDGAHKDTLEQDITSTWERILQIGPGSIPLIDLTHGGIEDTVAVFVSILFLANMGKISVWQEKPPYGEIFVEIADKKNIASIRATDEDIIDLTAITSTESTNGSTVVK